MPRYIDADFALKVYEEAYEITETATWNNPKQAEINKQSHDTVIKLINQAPTADVAEVRHGKWIIEEYDEYFRANIYRCSECERHIKVVAMINEKKYAPYCHCGAKMDKE